MRLRLVQASHAGSVKQAPARLVDHEHDEDVGKLISTSAMEMLHQSFTIRRNAIQVQHAYDTNQTSSDYNHLLQWTGCPPRNAARPTLHHLQLHQ